MGDANLIRTLRDYSKPSHEGYRNTIELPVGNNVVPLRSDTIRLVQNGCSFHGLWSEDPNQHLKDFLKLVDTLDLDGSIATLEDLTTRLIAQFFPSGRTTKLRNDILMFQQHQGESLSEAWTRFKDLLQKVLHRGTDLWLQVQIFYDHVTPVTRRTINQSGGGKLCDINAEESWALLEDLALYDNESWNKPRDFAKLVKAIYLPQDVLSASNRRLIELENQVQRLMEAHLAPMQPTPVNKRTTSCEICNGPHDTQYCIEDPEQAFVEYASSRTDEAGGLVSNFMASQDTRLSKFEVDFKQQQSKMTNKIDKVLKPIIDQMAGALPSDTVKIPKLNVNTTTSVLSACSYPTEDPQCSTHIYGSINGVTIHPKQQNDSHDDELAESGEEEKDSQENTNTNPSTSPDPSVLFIIEKIVKKNDDSLKEEPEAGGSEVEYFDILPTRSELAYHKYLMTDEVAYKMPYKIEQYNSLSDFEKEHTKSVYLRNGEDTRRGVSNVMMKILGFYKECLELGHEYVIGMDDEG
ncbi:MAK10-like protein [Tanacetum coccineum]